MKDVRVESSEPYSSSEAAVFEELRVDAIDLSRSAGFNFWIRLRKFLFH